MYAANSEPATWVRLRHALVLDADHQGRVGPAHPSRPPRSAARRWRGSRRAGPTGSRRAAPRRRVSGRRSWPWAPVPRRPRRPPPPTTTRPLGPAHVSPAAYSLHDLDATARRTLTERPAAVPTPGSALAGRPAAPSAAPTSQVATVVQAAGDDVGHPVRCLAVRQACSASTRR